MLLVVSCLDVLLPVITHIINCSLTPEEFPDCWKEALVSPLHKKSGVLSEFSNLRPVSNLQYVSKLMEHAVFDQTHVHLTYTLYSSQRTVSVIALRLHF